jgi:hypothetical protein
MPVELEMALRTVPPSRTDQELLAQCGHVPWGAIMAPPDSARPRRQQRVIASLFCSRIAMILTSVRVGLPARRRAGERAGRPMRLRTGAAVSRACFQSHEICTVNFMAISAIASGSSLLAPTLTSASMPRVPRKVTAVPDETPKLTF